MCKGAQKAFQGFMGRGNIPYPEEHIGRKALRQRQKRKISSHQIILRRTKLTNNPRFFSFTSSSCFLTCSLVFLKETFFFLGFFFFFAFNFFFSLFRDVAGSLGGSLVSLVELLCAWGEGAQRSRGAEAKGRQVLRGTDRQLDS